MSFLNTSEKKIAEKLIIQGFERAAQSFTSFARQEVSIEMADVDVSKEWAGNDALSKLKGELTLITTEMIGGLSGKSYLVFTREECDMLFQNAFPNHENNNRAMLEDAFLKELDNILSASVITGFSDFLEVEVYGDVPELHRGDAREIAQLVQQNFSGAKPHKDSIFLIANTKFIFNDILQLRPKFFWKLSEDFISLIRRIDESTQV